MLYESASRPQEPPVSCAVLPRRLAQLRAELQALEDCLHSSEEGAGRDALGKQAGRLRGEIAVAEQRLARQRVQILGVERTQAIQYFDFNGQGSGHRRDNAMGLRRHRDLILRAYVDVDVGTRLPIGRVRGRVSYERLEDGEPVEGFPERPAFNEPLPPRRADEVDRGDPNHTLNFRIPAEHCRGTVRFHVAASWGEEAAPQRTTSGAGTLAASDTHTFTEKFYPTPRANIYIVRIRYTRHPYLIDPPTGVESVEALGFALRSFPFAHVQFMGCEEHDFDGDLTSDGWSELLGLMEDIRNSTDIEALYLALLPRGVPGGTLAGSARGNVGAAFVHREVTIAHELGHTLGLDHVDPADPPLDDDYPDYGESYPEGSIGEFGFDHDSATVYDPADSQEIMSYGQQRWISPYNHIKLVFRLANRFGRPVTTTETPERQEWLHLRFRVLGTSGVALENAFHLPGGGPSPADFLSPLTAFSVELLDEHGDRLAWHRCRRQQRCGIPDPRSEDMTAVLPWRPAASTIAFFRDGAEIDRVDIDPEPPDIAVEPLEAIGEQRQRLQARWQARHPRQPVRCLMRYSNDGGATWRTVTVGSDIGAYAIDLEALPGGDDCCLQVVASAGARTSVAESEHFAVPQKPRRAYILAPPDGHMIGRHEPLALRGGGFSPGFGVDELEDSQWSSSLDGPLGAGHELLVEELSRGRHRITLTVPDGLGGETSRSVLVHVGG